MSDLSSTSSGNDAHEAPASRPSEPTLVPDRLLKIGRKVNGVGDAGKGYADTLGQGFELALTLVVFGAIGWFIDRSAGTSPTFTIGLGILGFVGISLKLWFGYDREMRDHEDGAIWNRRSSSAAEVDPS